MEVAVHKYPGLLVDVEVEPRDDYRSGVQLKTTVHDPVLLGDDQQLEPVAFLNDVPLALSALVKTGVFGHGL
jgi:hypothetical protein